MTEEQINPDRIDDDLQPPSGLGGTTEGAPTAGRELSEDEHDEAVTPDDSNKDYEVDGPQVGHA